MAGIIRVLALSSSASILSTYTLSTPLYVVKELLENSLDAGATSVAIEIDASTLGTITVKDNGHGVGKNDRNSMALRYTTSKLKTFDDLQNVSTLGFRGEGLNGIANIASEMILETRSISDIKVGERWSVNASGEIISNSVQNSARGVGTSIEVKGLYQNIPVRKGLLVKNSKKILESIRELVVSYSLLFPETRISFKILKSSAPSSNLVLIAKSKNILKLSTIFGSEFQSSLKEGSCSINKWDFSFIFPSSIGHFDKLIEPISTPLKTKFSSISVNWRPLNPTHPNAKKLVNRIKSHIPRNIQNLIWVFNIISPPGSFDVNIEPNKDDLYFYDMDCVLKMIDTVMVDVYKPIIQESDGTLMSGNDLLEAQISKPSLLDSDQGTPNVKLFEQDNFESELNTNFEFGQNVILNEVRGIPHSFEHKTGIEAPVLSAIRTETRTMTSSSESDAWGYSMSHILSSDDEYGQLKDSSFTNTSLSLDHDSCELLSPIQEPERQSKNKYFTEETNDSHKHCSLLYNPFITAKMNSKSPRAVDRGSITDITNRDKFDRGNANFDSKKDSKLTQSKLVLKIKNSEKIGPQSKETTIVLDRRFSNITPLKQFGSFRTMIPSKPNLPRDSVPNEDLDMSQISQPRKSRKITVGNIISDNQDVSTRSFFTKNLSTSKPARKEKKDSLEFLFENVYHYGIHLNKVPTYEAFVKSASSESDQTINEIPISSDEGNIKIIIKRILNNFRSSINSHEDSDFNLEFDSWRINFSGGNGIANFHPENR